MSNVKGISNNTATGKRTSITINQQVKSKLDEIGHINQSYSELIEQLTDYYNAGNNGRNGQSEGLGSLSQSDTASVPTNSKCSSIKDDNI